jgi:pimeloyl-ACP methyl ester carboxylesterase
MNLARAGWIMLATIAIMGAWFVVSGRAARLVLAIRILDDLRRPGSDSWLGRATPPPTVAPLVLATTRGSLLADLYRPPSGAGRVPVVLVPGLVEAGKDDPRVAPFARALARAGFSVVVPDLPSFRTLRVDPDQPRELAAAMAAVLARTDLAPEGRAGMFGISYAGGIALLVATDSTLAARVPFVAIVGGYADLDSSLRYLATGRTIDHGRVRMVKPERYGQLIFLKTFEEFLDSPGDRSILEAMANRRENDPAASLADLAPGLSARGRLIYELFEGTDPGRVPGLIEALPEGLKTRMAELSPARHGLGGLRAHLYLVHARDDGTFPVSEARRLADMARAGPGASMARGLPRLVVLDALQHVTLEVGKGDAWQFLTRELPEAVALTLWWYALMGERAP